MHLMSPNKILRKHRHSTMLIDGSRGRERESRSAKIPDKQRTVVYVHKRLTVKEARSSYVCVFTGLGLLA